MRPTLIKNRYTVNELYEIARKENNAKIRARILGIAAALEGKKRTVAAKIAGVNENIFRVWIKRFNENGIDGLKSIKQSGRPEKIKKEVKDILKEKILAGADYKRDGLIRFRLVDIKDFLQKDHGVKYCQSGVWYLLKQIDLSWISVRPIHPKSDENKMQEFKDEFKKKSKL